MENEAVLRDLRGVAKTRNTVARIVMVQALAGPLSLQIGRGKGVLSTSGDSRSLVAPGVRTQIKKSAFERMMLSELKLATALRVLPENATGVFKDSYLLDFLDLPDTHSEADLQTGLLRYLRKFLMELGDGFAFVGEKVRVQVGNQDFELDLLFFHRDLQCLVAFELKTGRFEPEHTGKLAFYLEALDRDRKRPHENPSIGVLLCRTKDDEVVEYAMNRHLSPALVTQYETQMIPKAMLRQKLHEWNQLLQMSSSLVEEGL